MFVRFLLSALLVLASVSLGWGRDIQVGEAFPSLVLPSLETGEPASVADYRGRKLVLHVWASW